MHPQHRCWFTTIVARIAFLLVAITATGCKIIPPLLAENWNYADLRILDSVDAHLPEAELIALYSRLVADEIQIRLDMLNIDPQQPVDLYFFFDSTPGVKGNSSVEFPKFPGQQDWDYLLVLPGSGPSAFYERAGNALSHPRLSIFRDTFLDTIYISLDRNNFSTPMSSYSVTIVSTSASRFFEIQDVIGPIDSQDPPPPPVEVLLTFSDVFQSSTPAQALRSWDGAHTGPDSGRHGLRHLLNAVDSYHLPVSLSGIEEQRFRAALDYLEVDGRYLLLGESGLLFENQSCNGEYDYAHFTTIDASGSATPAGLASSMIIKILNAFVEDPHSPILLSSPLQNTYWGSPESAGPTLAYIAGHPWLKLINSNQVPQTPCNSDRSQTDISKEGFYYRIIERYKNQKPNNLNKLAWDTYSTLAAPGTNDRQLLLKNYLPQVGHIFAAAQWANYPAPLADCSIDLDWDGLPECVLANSHIFTTYELKGGYLAFAFFADEHGAHQMIGPSYQLSVGLSDPFAWDSQAGLSSDPAQILGALNIPITSQERFAYSINQGKLVLESPSVAMRKIFAIDESSLTMTMVTNSPSGELQIPFIIDPWLRFQSDWTDLYRIEKYGDRWVLSAADHLAIQVSSSSPLTVSSFLGPLQYINHPEDPNTDYTPGYFLPFPMILMEGDNQEEFSIQINLTQ